MRVSPFLALSVTSVYATLSDGSLELGSGLLKMIVTKNYSSEVLAEYELGEVMDWLTDIKMKSDDPLVTTYNYRTESARGEPKAAAGVILVPSNNNQDSIINYQVSGFENGCEAPEVWLSQGNDQHPKIINTLLDRGHVVNIPGYEMDSLYGSGIYGGVRVLDSVRAAINDLSAIVGFNNTKVSMWGYSDGALATGWAAELQQSYAPELNISAVALGEPMSNMTSTLLRANNGPSPLSNIVPSTLVGLANTYPGLWNELDPVLTKGREPLYSGDTCAKTLAPGVGSSFDNFVYFKNGADVLQMPLLHEILVNMTLGMRNTPNMPMYVYETDLPEVSNFSDPGDISRMVNFYCSNGAKVRYENFTQKYPEDNYAIDFMEQAFNGTLELSKCERSERTTFAPPEPVTTTEPYAEWEGYLMSFETETDDGGAVDADDSTSTSAPSATARATGTSPTASASVSGSAAASSSPDSSVPVASHSSSALKTSSGSTSGKGTAGGSSSSTNTATKTNSSNGAVVAFPGLGVTLLTLLLI